MICHLKFIFAWILLKPQLTDGVSVTWYEPTPVQTSSNPAEALIPGMLHVYEGSSVTLNWSYNLSSTFVSARLQFSGADIVIILSNGQAGPVNVSFRQRFTVKSTHQSISLLISKVTSDEDRSRGEFGYELNDVSGAKWRRAIQVQVVVLPNVLEISGETTVPEGGNLNLTCITLGQPKPNITWTKEKPGNQGNTVVEQEGKVLNITHIKKTDAGNYTCTANNGFGEPESQTVYVNVTFIGGKWITITIDIIVGKYNVSSLSDGFDKVFKDVFSGHGYEKVEVRDDRIVTLALKFKSTTRQTYVVNRLRDAVVNGYLGKFAVCPTCIKGASCDITLPIPTPTPTPTHTGSPYGLKKGIIIAIAIVASLFLVIIVGNLCCWYFSTTICIVVVFGFIRKCLCKKNPDSKVHSNGGQDARMEAGYSSPDNQYAAAGPKANYRASNPSSEPSVTCEVANRGSEGRRGNKAGEPREQPPEYAVVDKTKKKKKGPKPGECQYVEFNQLIGYGVIDDYQHFFFNRKDILAEPLQLKSIFSQQSQNGAT